MNTLSTRTCKKRLNFGSQKHAKQNKNDLQKRAEENYLLRLLFLLFLKMSRGSPQTLKNHDKSTKYHKNPIVFLWHVASFHEELAPIPSCFSTLFRVRSVARVNKYEHAVPKIGEHSAMCFNNFEGAERAEFKTEITAPLFRQCSLLSSVWQWYAMISALNSIISCHILWEMFGGAAMTRRRRLR